MEPEIHITVEPTGGEVKVEVHNVQGPSCKQLSKPYTDLFRAESTQLKPEYHATERQPAKQRTRQG